MKYTQYCNATILPTQTDEEREVGSVEGPTLSHLFPKMMVLILLDGDCARSSQDIFLFLGWR